MARNTITDVRAKVETINQLYDDDLTFNCWGVGTNKYQLINEEGKTFGPVCAGASEFLTFLKGFNAGLRYD